MNDKDVGELWTRANRGPYGGGVEIKYLIRKLVEERALRWMEEQGIAGGTAGFYKALRDFGIDRETWEGSR